MRFGAQTPGVDVEIQIADVRIGEDEVWEQFSAHYAQELPQTRTVLIPHHGAAPHDGLSFYNKELNAARNVVTVISVGARNSYAHPRGSVLQEILRMHGLVQIVTEHSWPGLLESVCLE